MIRRLQKRMILLVVCGLLLASAGLVFAVNWINWRSIRSQAEGILDMLAENDGKMDDAAPSGGQPIGDPDGPRGRGRGRGNDLRSAANLISSYTIRLDGEGGVTSWSSSLG